MYAIDRQLAELAARHHFLVRRRDALAAGIHRDALERRVRAGVLRRLATGIYLYGAAPPSWHARVLAAVWAGGAEAVASHTTAVRIHGREGPSASLIEVTVPHGRHVEMEGVRFHERRVPVTAADRTVVDGIRVTTLTRTLVDLAWWKGIARCAHLLDGLQRDQVITDLRPVQVRVESLRGRGRKRTGRLSEHIAGRVGAQPTTVLERRFLEAVRRAGLPEPVCQHPIELGSGAVIHVDFAWPVAMVVTETDGRLGHAADGERQRDHERDARLGDLGWTVRRFTYRDVVDRPEHVIGVLRSAINAGLAVQRARKHG